MRRKSAILVATVLTFVLLFSSVNVFAEGTDQNTISEDSEKAGSGGTAGMIRRHKAKRHWKNEEGLNKEEMKENLLERFESMLSNIVEQEIITQDKADEILNKYEERLEAIETKMKERKAIGQQLVEEGILTQEEADELEEALKEKREEMREERKENEGDKIRLNRDDKKNVLNQVLSDLADKDILTQEKLDEITEYIEAKVSEWQEKRKDGGFWEQMVADEIITQEEADEIKETAKKNLPPRPMGRNRIKNRQDK